MNPQNAVAPHYLNAEEGTEPGGEAVAITMDGREYTALSKGMDNHAMVEGMHEGKIRALYLIGEDMISSESNKRYLAGGLEKLELFVVQEIFFTLTCQYADATCGPADPSGLLRYTGAPTWRRSSRSR